MGQLSWHLRLWYAFKAWPSTSGCFIAYRLPDWVLYWAAIKMGAWATSGQYSTTIVPELTVMAMLDRWERKLRGESK